MKNLKRFLIIGLFSFVFLIGKVSALTTFNTTRISIIDSYLTNHTDKTINDFIDEEIIPYFTFPNGFDETDDYVMLISSVSNQPSRLRLDYMTGTYNISMWNSNIFLRLNSPGTLYHTFFDFNSNGTHYPYTFSWSHDGTYSQTSIDNLNASQTGYGNFLVTSSQTHYIISTSYNSFKYEQKSMYTDSFRIGSGSTYNFNSDIPSNFLSNGGTYDIDVYNRLAPPVPITCNHNQVLGAVSNATDLVFKIKGVSNALAKPIWGRIMLEFSDSSFHTSDEFNVEFINFLSGQDADVEGSYSFTCNDSGSACFLEYSYNYIDDIDTNVEFGFKIRSSSGNTMPSFIKLFNCFDNDDYYNITYTYTNSSGGTISNDNILNNFLQDGSVPDVSGLSDTNIIPTGPVDSILTLPLNIMRSLLNTLNSSTCSPLVLPIPFSGGNLTLPCISTLYAKINGLNVFLTWFSSIFSAFLLYQYFIYLYKWVDDTLTFRENNHFGGY